MTYAVTRARDVNSEVKWDSARNTWKRATSPAAEMVLLILRTQRGRCLVDPDMGVDWAKVDKLRTDASATANAIITAALAPLVSDGKISELSVRADVYPVRGMIAFDVSFVDVQLRTRERVTGEA